MVCGGVPPPKRDVCLGPVLLGGAPYFVGKIAEKFRTAVVSFGGETLIVRPAEKGTRGFVAKIAPLHARPRCDD